MRSTLLLPSSLPDIALCTLSLVSVTCLTLRATRAHGRRALRSPGLLVQIHVLQGILSSFTHLISVSLSLARLLPLPYTNPCRSHAPCHCFNRDSCVLWSDHTLCSFSLSPRTSIARASYAALFSDASRQRTVVCFAPKRSREEKRSRREEKDSVCLSVFLVKQSESKQAPEPADMSRLSNSGGKNGATESRGRVREGEKCGGKGEKGRRSGSQVTERDWHPAAEAEIARLSRHQQD